MTRILIPGLLLAFLLGSCGGFRLNRLLTEQQGDWVMYGGDPSRANTTTERVQPPLREVWQYNAQGGISGSPLVRDSVVIVGTLHGEIQAVNLTTGKRIGYRVLEGPVVGTPLLDENRLVLSVSGNAESLLMFDLESGSRIWSAVPGPIESSPLLHKGALYVATLLGTVVSIDKSSGEELWEFKTGSKVRREPIRSSPAAEENVVCVGSDDGFVYGLDRESGRLQWKVNTGSSVFASPAVLAGLAVVGNLHGTIHAIDVQIGAVRWMVETGSRIYGPVSGTRHTVYAGCADGTLRALDIEDGSLVWEFNAESVINSAPLIAGDLLFVGSLDKTLYVLERRTGKERWRYAAEGRIRVSPVLWGDYLLVTSEDRYITALRPEGSF